jgi:hypothetical protein
MVRSIALAGELLLSIAFLLLKQDQVESDRETDMLSRDEDGSMRCISALRPLPVVWETPKGRPGMYLLCYIYLGNRG